MLINKAVPIPISYERLVGQPLDSSDIYTSLDLLQQYLVSGSCYNGQFVALIENNKTIPYLIAENNGHKILMKLATDDNTQTSTSGDTYIPLTFVDEDPNYFSKTMDFVTYTTLNDWTSNGWLEMANGGIVNPDTGKLYKNRWIIIVKVSENTANTLEYVAFTQPFSVSQQGYALAEKKTIITDYPLTNGFNRFAATETNIVYACDYTRVGLYKSINYGKSFTKIQDLLTNSIITSKDGKYIYVIDGITLKYSNNYGVTFIDKMTSDKSFTINISKDGKIVYLLNGKQNAYQYSNDYGASFKNIDCPYVYNALSAVFSSISESGAGMSINRPAKGKGIAVSFNYGQTFKNIEYDYSNIQQGQAPSGINYPEVKEIFNSESSCLYIFDEYNFTIKFINKGNEPLLLSNARSVGPFYDKSKHLNEVYDRMVILGYVSSFDKIYYIVTTHDTLLSDVTNTYICYYDITNDNFVTEYSFKGLSVITYASKDASLNGFMTLVYNDGSYITGMPNMSIRVIKPMDYVLDYIRDGILYQLPLVAGNGIYISHKTNGDLQYLEISTSESNTPSVPGTSGGTGDAPYKFIREGYIEQTVSPTYPNKLVYVLSNRPYPETISVFMNGVYLPPKDENGVVNYTTDLNYLILSNTLSYFNNQSGIMSQITIDTYDQIDVTYFVAKSMSGGDNTGGGSVSGIPSIDPITKHWMINGIDTEIHAEGRSNLLRIKQITTQDIVFEDNYEAYYLENPTSNVNFTLKLDNNVDKINKILSYEVHIKLDTVKDISFPSTIKWVGTPPDKSLGANYYYVFIFRSHDGGITWTGNLAYKFPINAITPSNVDNTDTIIITFKADSGLFTGQIDILDSSNNIVHSIVNPGNGVKYISGKQFNFSAGGYKLDYSKLYVKPTGTNDFVPIKSVYGILYYINGTEEKLGITYNVNQNANQIMLSNRSGSMTHDIDLKVIPFILIPPIFDPII